LGIIQLRYRHPKSEEIVVSLGIRDDSSHVRSRHFASGGS
jgi:hypothetical protein